MAKLTTTRRNKLKTSTFGLPSERKYPMPDKSHALNAKARASQQFNKGNLSASEKAKIDRKADKILGESTMKKQGRHDKTDERKGEDKMMKRKRKDSRDERRGEEDYEKKRTRRVKKDKADERKGEKKMMKRKRKDRRDESKGMKGRDYGVDYIKSM